jgi:Mn2+/Fe2+ NRAMP family transporter
MTEGSLKNPTVTAVLNMQASSVSTVSWIMLDAKPFVRSDAGQQSRWCRTDCHCRHVPCEANHWQHRQSQRNRYNATGGYGSGDTGVQGQRSRYALRQSRGEYAATGGAIRMSDVAENELIDRRTAHDVVDPPRTFSRIFRQIGPGLIIAANIVGSGELIMTTKTGAEAGIVLLWLILLGCLIKVFVQLELGRYTISAGTTTLTALNQVPGPRLGGLNWIVLFWAFMMLTTIGQLGGIVAGVGQALSLTFPLTGDYEASILTPPEDDLRDYTVWKSQSAEASDPRIIRRMERIEASLDRLGERGTRLVQMINEDLPLTDDDGNSLVVQQTVDDKIWCILIGLVTSVVLYVGRYRMLERFSVVLVVSFTLITIGNIISLQWTQYAISSEELAKGLAFQLPSSRAGLITALATLGIIGVGATELIAYPYFCLEKGYARSAGPRDSSEAWLQRAHGWFRVMRVDAFSSMAIYTVATAAFFLMGVAVLHSQGLNPTNDRMVSTLAESYVPVFGAYARWLFLLGAISVLYSTYLVANAGNARMFADFFGVVGLHTRDADSPARAQLVRLLSAGLPLACVAAFLVFQAPVAGLMKINALWQSGSLREVQFCCAAGCDSSPLPPHVG